MTDRVMALTVLLDRDMREDDVQALIDAIGLLAHVKRVEKAIVTGAQALANYRARTEAAESLMKAAREMLEGAR